jgi:lysophospholipase
MLVGHQGYVPEPYFLTQSLRSQNRFHDPLEDSLFSHAGSVQGYRDWSAGSGRSSPVGSAVSAPLPEDPQAPTLLVRSSRPIGVTAALGPGPAPSWRNQPQCVKVADNVYEANLPSLITPRTKVPGKNGSKAIRYAILEVSYCLF